MDGADINKINILHLLELAFNSFPPASSYPEILLFLTSFQKSIKSSDEVSNMCTANKKNIVHSLQTLKPKAKHAKHNGSNIQYV